IPPAVVDKTPPSVPANVVAHATGPTQVMLTWSPSSDNVGVSGYDVLRGGTVIGTSATASYTDNTVTPNTQYAYTVEAYDAAGNVSMPSTPPATVTTPPASTNPPVISGIAVKAIT